MSCRNPKLEQWIYWPTGTLRVSACLEGVVTGHPHIDDGERVWTSTVMEFHPEEGWARTRNTTYELGERAASRN